MPHFQWLALSYGGTRSVPLWIYILSGVVLGAMIVAGAIALFD